METAFAPEPDSDNPSLERNIRRSPRVLISATAMVSPDGRATTEHMTYDFSTGGVRLCGLPSAQEGDRLNVLLQLPRGRVHVLGRLLRLEWTAERPDFAVEFLNLSSRAEDAIQDAMVEALFSPGLRSVLLVETDEERPVSGDGWLAPISPICAVANTYLEAAQSLTDHSIRVGILGRATNESSAPAWSDEDSNILWRTIDEEGCLYRIWGSGGKTKEEKKAALLGTVPESAQPSAKAG